VLGAQILMGFNSAASFRISMSNCRAGTRYWNALALLLMILTLASFRVLIIALRRMAKPQVASIS
jgi:hypothetical protein